MMNCFRPKTEKDIIDHILKEIPSIYLQSKTSTVINYGSLESECKKSGVTLVDLCLIKPSMEWRDHEHVSVKGYVTWKDLKDFVHKKGKRLMTTPTEELAGVLAGIATSCTGEHAFSDGTLRDQLIECKYIDYKGQKVKLDKNKSIVSLINDQNLLENYQKNYKHYQNFKNAPFPRLQVETDLMIGSEGQLGVITEVVLKTAVQMPTDYYFILVPQWENNVEAHLEIFEKAQEFRGKILSLEFIDWNSLSYLPKTEWSKQKNHDVIFMEVLCHHSEEIYSKMLSRLTTVDMDAVFSFDEYKFQNLRKAVPRFVGEANARKGVVKKGTDVQVAPKDLKTLFNYYREFSQKGINYTLFGHLGDAHLHFNFLPDSKQTNLCDELLANFYQEIASIGASPFAEHGIGLIKQKYMKEFWDETTKLMFKKLKMQFDPKGLFFPNGFMQFGLED